MDQREIVHTLIKRRNMQRLIGMFHQDWLILIEELYYLYTLYLALFTDT